MATDAHHSVSLTHATAMPAEVLQLQGSLYARRQEIERYVRSRMSPRLRAHVECQDIMQETYFEAFRKIAEFTPNDSSSLDRWLQKIATNKMREVLRRSRRQRRGGGRRANNRNDESG